MADQMTINTPNNFFSATGMDRVPDAKENLPPEAQERLEWLQKQDWKLSGERNALRAEMTRLKQESDEFEVHTENEDRARRKLGMADDVETLARIERTRAENRRRREALNDAINALPEPVCAKVDEFLAKRPNVSHRMEDIPRIDFEPDIFGQLARAQTETDTGTSALMITENAPLTLAEAEQAIKRQLKQWTKGGKPSVSQFFQGFSLTPHTGRYRVGNPNATVRFAEEWLGLFVQGAEPVNVVNPVKLIAWLFPDEFEAKLLDLARKSERAGAIPTSEKPARIAAAKRRLLEAQRIEEELIRECERRGATVRRRCTDPIVLLGICEIGGSAA